MISYIENKYTTKSNLSNLILARGSGVCYTYHVMDCIVAQTQIRIREGNMVPYDKAIEILPKDLYCNKIITYQTEGLIYKIQLM